MKKIPKFYFSFRSPYSWLSYKIMYEKYYNLLGNMEIIPYWEPESSGLLDNIMLKRGAVLHYSKMSKEKHLYILSDIKRIASYLGYTIKWPVDTNPNWDIPHLAFFLTKKYDKHFEFMAEIYRARFEFGRDICSIEILKDVINLIGLSSNLLDDIINSNDILEEGLKALSSSYSDDVFGVPFFILGREKFWGFDRLKLFIDQIHDCTHVTKIDLIDFIPHILDTDCPGGCG